MTFYNKQFFPATYFTAGYFTSSDGPGKITVYPTTARSRMYSNIPTVDATAEYQDSNRWGRRPVVVARKQEQPGAKFATAMLDGARTGLSSGTVKIYIQNAIGSSLIARRSRSKAKAGDVSLYVSQSRTVDILPSVLCLSSGSPMLSKTNNPTESEVAMILMEFF